MGFFMNSKPLLALFMCKDAGRVLLMVSPAIRCRPCLESMHLHTIAMDTVMQRHVCTCIVCIEIGVGDSDFLVYKN